MNKDSIENAHRLAAENKWTFPQLFEALKKIGVDRYEVDVLKHESKYVLGKLSVSFEAPADFKPLDLGNYDAAAVKAAIMRTQNGESDYEDFLKDIAAAGILFYRVDMKPATVTYHAKDRRYKIVEPVIAA